MKKKDNTFIVQKGFTLIELMISASILGLIGLAVLTTFGSGFHVYERVQVFGGLQAEVLLSLEEMERDLSNTLPYSGIAFKGEGKKLVFPIAVEEIKTSEDEEEQDIVGASLGQITYYLKDDNGQKVLMRTLKNYSAATSLNSLSDDQDSALTNVKDLAFSYYASSEEKGFSGWKDAWTAGGSVPAAVKIELTYEDRGSEIKLVRTVFIPSVRIIDEIVVVDEEEEEEEGVET